MAVSTRASDVFERTLQDFKQDLTPTQRVDFAATTLQQLHSTIEVIQRKQASTRTMQNLRRISKFLEAMETYSKVLDVFVNVNDFVAFIWGPIKYLLLVAQTFADAFNALLDAYQQIAENLPIFEQCQDFFGNDPRMQTVLEAIFKDVLEFHSMALEYFGKKGENLVGRFLSLADHLTVWKQLFHATWKNFNAKFRTLLDNKRSHKELVGIQANLSALRAARNAREHAFTKFQATAEFELHMKILRAFLQGAINLEADSGCVAEAYITAGLTAIPTPRPYFGYMGFLVVIGKSVLASWIVEEAMKLTDVTVLYFYCRNGDARRSNFVAMARCFLAKLLRIGGVVAQLLDSSMVSGEPTLRTQKLAGQLLKTAFKAAGRKYIVLDGLDECDVAEQKYIATWLKDYVNSSSSEQEPSKCVFLSQKDPCTNGLLSKLPTLRISADDDRADIEAYCSAFAAKLQTKFGISNVKVSSIASDTARRAQGMFLYAHFVMQNLLDQNSCRDLEDELRPDVFPDGFDQAYGRILHRVLVSSTKSNQRDAKKVLAWMVCAVRPLKWREVQAAFSIDIEAQKVDIPRNKRLLGPQDLCGALIEEGQGDDGEAHVNPSIEHLNLASMCLEYFSMPILWSETTDDQLEEHICNGSYGFVDYAVVNWAKHVELSLAANPPADMLTGFGETLQALFDIHWQDPRQKSKTSKYLLDTFKLSSSFEEELRDRLVATVSSTAIMLSSRTTEVDSIATTTTMKIARRIRRILELLQQDRPDMHTTLGGYYGNRLFKCGRMYCYQFYQGFDTEKDRESHREKHERSHYCTHFGCPIAALGCATKKLLDAHIAVHHPQYSVNAEFPDDGDDPKTSAANGVANAGRDLARHYCDQCDKSFTKSYNLAAHKRRHDAEQSSTCTVCGKTFGRESECKRHQRQQHGREEKFKCGGMTKAGAAWGCGNDFGRADLLGRHFRTATGRACKQPLVDAMLADGRQLEASQPDESEIIPFPEVPELTAVASTSDDTTHLHPLLFSEDPYLLDAPSSSPTGTLTPDIPTSIEEHEQLPQPFLTEDILQEFPELAQVDWDGRFPPSVP